MGCGDVGNMDGIENFEKALVDKLLWSEFERVQSVAWGFLGYAVSKGIVDLADFYDFWERDVWRGEMIEGVLIFSKA